MKTNVTYSKESTLEMYNRARSNLLVMIALTLVNIILYMIGSSAMMLFSATVPYASIIMASVLSGTPIATMLLILAAGTVLLYFLCWIFSKKHVAWMIVALVLFSIDTAALLGLAVIMEEVSSLLDMLIHAWVLYYLIIGVRDGLRLRKLEKAPIETPRAADIPESTEPEESDTSSLYLADMTVKARILLEAKAMGYHICYRRVKSTNELVIDGYVYDTLEMLLEPPHTLSAKLGGHFIQVGNDGFRSYIRVDGKMIARKVRIW